MRNKFISNEEAKVILQHSGLPVRLVSGATPQCFQNLPSGSHIYTSGANMRLGVEIYRDSSTHPEASAGYILNCDDYSGYLSSSGYEVQGPYYDPKRHWATGMPPHLSLAPVIDSENKTQ